jgi:hypothetical protein
VQVVNEPLSSWQAKVAASVAVKLKLAVVAPVDPEVPEVMVVSGGVLSTVTVIAADVVELPDGSLATAVIVAVPSGREDVFQLTPNGEVVSVPTTVPLTWKLTEATTTLSLAVADRVTVPLTFAPLDGAVSETVGGVVSNMLVVKLQDWLLRELPARSLIPFVPPTREAV